MRTEYAEIFFFKCMQHSATKGQNTTVYITKCWEKKLQKRTLAYIAIYQKVHLFAIRESNDIQWEG